MESTKEVLEKLLQDEHCLIHVNTTFPGITLPDHLRTNPSVTLKISYYFSGALSVTDKEISTELRFGGNPFTCIIPIDAVWGATSFGGFHTTWDSRAPNPILPVMLKKDQKEQKDQKGAKPKLVTSTSKENKPAKEKASFLKRIK